MIPTNMRKLRAVNKRAKKIIGNEKYIKNDLSDLSRLTFFESPL